MTRSRKNAVRLLAAGALVLVALVVLLIVGLRRTDRDGDAPAQLKAAPPLPATAAERPRGRSARASRLDPTPVLRGADDRVSAAAPANRIREPAPSALPAEITRETDPQRRAELLRMHRLAMARVRASVLKRRQALLGNTIARAQRDNTPAQRIRELEGEMAELRIALQRAEHELAGVSATPSGK